MRRLVLALLTLAACDVRPAGTPEPDPVPAPLVRTVPLAPGDDCEGGGVAILTGQDDGTGDGTALDGVLQEGEVRDREVVCAPVLPDPVEPPSPWPPLAAPLGPPGERVLSSSGGAGVTDGGGNGGQILLRIDPPASRGQIVVHPTGRAEPQIPEIDDPVVALGSNPLTVDEDLVVETVADPTLLPAGTVYVTTSAPGRLQRTGTPDPITGIDIRSGATLTFRALPGRVVDVALNGPVRNAGTLRARSDSDTPTDLRLSCDTYVDTPGALVDARGLDGGTNAPAGPGASVQIVAVGLPPQAPVRLGSLVVQGTIDTRGGTGVVGARGGPITLTTIDVLHVRGSLLSSGGAGTTLGAGIGGSIRLTSEGPITLSGTVDTSAPDGSPSGARGGNLELTARGVLIDADIDISGGSVGGCQGSCNGGDAGKIDIISRDAPVAWTGRVTARGGDGTGAASLGGLGGAITIATTPEIGLGVSVGAPDRTVTLSADLRLDGGDGVDDGGSGGSLVVEVDGWSAPASSIRLLGYAAISLLGGAADPSNGDGAGDGGGIQASIGVSGFDPFADGGGIAIGVPLRLDGACGRLGGNGGIVQVSSSAGAGPAHPDREAWITAPISATGGCGAMLGGRSGRLSVSGPFGVRILGQLDAAAGEASAPRSGGGTSGRIQSVGEAVLLNSRLGTVRLSAPMDLHGGDGDASGGDGASARIVGWGVAWGTEVLLSGGAARGGDGGDGGYVLLTVGEGGLAWTGSVDLDAGDGTRRVGVPGRLFVNGLDETAVYVP